MNPRQRRLAADYAALAQAFDASPYVDIAAVGSLPPERYKITYRIPGLRLNPFGQAVREHEHRFEITLPSAYPRQQPYVVPLSPVFHPNISAHVCIADFWSPSQSLLDTVVQIADMLQYQLYNINSPLDAVAARWVEQNGHQIPVGRVRVRPAEDRPAPPAAAPPAWAGHSAVLVAAPPTAEPQPEPGPGPEGDITRPMRVQRPASSIPNAEGSR